MNILHICNAYQSNSLYRELMTRLLKLGAEQTVIAPGAKDGVVIDNGINVINVKRSKNLFIRAFWFLKIYKIYKTTKSSVECKKIDLIHAHTLFSDGAVAYLLGKKYGIKYCVAVRNTDLNIFFKIPIIKNFGYKILKQSSAVYLISEANKRQLGTLLPSHVKENLSSKLYVIPNGINDFWLNNISKSERKINADSIRLIYAGDICYNKNIHTILKVLPDKSRFNIKLFTAVGYNESDNSKYAGNIKSESNYLQNFSLLPKCKKEVLLQLYGDSDIYLQPSFTETFGLSYIEALTQGLPVIYSEGQGIDGMFEDGYIGYAVNPHDEKDMVKKISLICERYCEIQNNIRNVDFNRFSWDRISEEYYKHYNSILKG